jgi:hypothetical protein
MFILDGKRLAPNKAFTTSDGRQFPSNWLKLTTIEEKQAIGIEIQPDPVAEYHDQRFYWSAELPKDHDQLKEQWVATTKQTAGSLLSQYDWYITRQAETGKAVPQEVLDYRAVVRTQSDNREVMINGTADTEQLAAVITSDFGGMFPWPRGPFEPAPVADELSEEPVSGSDTLSFDGVTSGTAITGSAVLGGSGEDVISF